MHRDVTPPNIVRITHDGQARWVIADFGLVRRPRGLTTVVRTMVGSEFGTAGFAAPEAWDDPHAMTAQADIYSLGRVVAWAVTGRLPAPNRTLLPDDGPWRTFVQRATQDEPTARPISMRALVALMDSEPQPFDRSARHPNLISDPVKHTIIAQRDVSTGVAKRYAADVLVDRGANLESIRAIVRVVTIMLRGDRSYRDIYSPASQPERATDVVFLFIYLSLDDAANTNWRCRAQWVNPQMEAAFRPMPLRADEWLDDIAIDWNEEQETRSLLNRAETATKREYLGEVDSVTPQMEAFVTEADTLLAAREVGQLADDAYLAAMCRLEPSMSRLHNQTGRAGLPPTELRDLNTAYRSALVFQLHLYGQSGVSWSSNAARIRAQVPSRRQRV